MLKPDKNCMITMFINISRNRIQRTDALSLVCISGKTETNKA